MFDKRKLAAILAEKNKMGGQLNMPKAPSMPTMIKPPAPEQFAPTPLSEANSQRGMAIGQSLSPNPNRFMRLRKALGY